MEEKNRYLTGGVIFAALLLYRLYGLVRFVMIWATQNIYDAWVLTVSPRFSETLFIVHMICLALALIALIVMTRKSFRKNPPEKKAKSMFIFFYGFGILLPCVIRNAAVRVAPSGMILPILCVVLFAIAAWRVLPTKGEKQAEKPSEAEERKKRYYQDLYEQGVISPEEFQAMQEKIRNGQM